MKFDEKEKQRKTEVRACVIKYLKYRMKFTKDDCEDILEEQLESLPRRKR